MPTTADPPTIDDLLWEADRVSVHQLDDDTRRLLELVGEQIGEAWPIDDGIDPEEWVDRSELVEALGDLVNLTESGEGVVTVANIVAAVTAALERARAEGEKDATIPSRAGTAERKAMRLLVERRVTVQRCDPDGGRIIAECRGDEGNYVLGYDETRKQWRCTCPELRGQCSHLLALKMLTTR